jgi:general secretion pathway protein E
MAEGKEVDIRVATFNTIYGETAVLRILDKSLTLLELSELGLSTQALERYRGMLKAPFGMIAVSGPTGAGKTTTLYASVNQLNNVERNIVTIEDPVEYAYDGIKPSEINLAADLTFASGLRSILRIDPDVILVGEIRDEETAQIAVQASLTGHLVLSSIHANDAVGSLLRLMFLGVEPFLLSSALTGVVAQRMVRRVCPYCGMLREPEPDDKAAYEQEMQEVLTGFHYGTGCDLCAQTGYLGRTCIFEVMLITEEIRTQILKGVGRDEIHARAIKEGMTTMRHDGMLKVKQGITTPYEVLRAAYYIG